VTARERDGAPERTGATEQSQLQALMTQFDLMAEDVAAWLHYLDGKVTVLEARLTCRRCSAEPPPLARYYPDARAREYRPPHTCGLPPWSR
jgi:hypothetical protein